MSLLFQCLIVAALLFGVYVLVSFVIQRRRK